MSGPPSISGAVGNQAVANQDTSTPLAPVTISDAGVGATDTVTVTLTNPADKTLSNLGGGSFYTGVYSITGTPMEATAAIDGLVFTPALLTDVFVSTTTLTVTAIGSGGTVSDSTTNVTSVDQLLGLATVPAGQLAIVASPDGSFGAAQSGFTNEAVVSSPVALSDYTLPDRYQAEFLGGSADAGLFDNTVGNALLVGNNGNDTLAGAAANNTIVGGGGTNLLGGGDDTTIFSNGSHDTVVGFGNSLSVFAAGDGTSVFGNFANANSSLNVSVQGALATVVAGDSDVSATLGGSSDIAFGTFGGGASLNVLIEGGADSVVAGTGFFSSTTVTANGTDAAIYGEFSTADGFVTQPGGSTASMYIVDNGTADTVVAGNTNTTVKLNGNNALVAGGFGPFTGARLSVLDSGQNNTIVTGNDNAAVTVSGGDAIMVGGSGSLQFIDSAGFATVFAGSGAATVTGPTNGTGGVTMLGAPGAVISLVGGTFGGIVGFAGSGNETLVGSGHQSLLCGGTDPAGNDLLIAGPADVLYAGAGSNTFAVGSGHNIINFDMAGLGSASPHDFIANFAHGDKARFPAWGGQDPIAGVTSSGGNTTVALSDGAQITFLGIASASSLSIGSFVISLV